MHYNSANSPFLSPSPLLTHSVTQTNFSSPYLYFDKQQRASLSVNDFGIKLVQIIKCLWGRKAEVAFAVCYAVLYSKYECVFVRYTLLPINKITLNILWGLRSGIFFANLLLLLHLPANIVIWFNEKILKWFIDWLILRSDFFSLVYTFCHIQIRQAARDLVHNRVDFFHRKFCFNFSFTLMLLLLWIIRCNVLLNLFE